MTGSQIKTNLSQIIDAIAEEQIEGLISSASMEQRDVEAYDRNDAIDELIKMIEFYRETL